MSIHSAFITRKQDLVFKDEDRCYIKGLSVDKLVKKSKEHPESIGYSNHCKLSPCGSWYAIVSDTGTTLFEADTHEKIEDIKTGDMFGLWTSTEYCVCFGDDSYVAIAVNETAVSCSFKGRALPSPNSKLTEVVKVLQSKDRTLVFTGKAIYDTQNPNHRLELLSR